MADHITIDGAGRVVIPSAVRARLHLRPGTKLTVQVEGGRVVLEPVDDREALAREDGLLVATGVLVGPVADHRELREAQIVKHTRLPARDRRR